MCKNSSVTQFPVCVWHGFYVIYPVLGWFIYLLYMHGCNLSVVVCLLFCTELCEVRLIK